MSFAARRKQGKAYDGVSDDPRMMSTGLSARLPEMALWLIKNAYVNPLFFAGTQFNADGTPVLEWFDLAQHIEENALDPDMTIIRFGRRRTGKSFSTRWDMYNIAQYFPRGMVFSNTEHLNHFFDKWIPRKYIMGNLNVAILMAFLDYIGELKENEEQYRFLKKIDPNFNRTFLILDDVISTNDSVRYIEPIGRVFTQGRHSECMVNFNTQYANAVSPLMKENTDFAYIFQPNGVNQMEALYRSYVLRTEG